MPRHSFDSYEALALLLVDLTHHRFEGDHVVYDPVARRWSARILRGVDDPRRVIRTRTGFFSHRDTVPVVESVLIIDNVTAYRMENPHAASVDLFNGFERTANGLRLFCSLWITVELEIEGLVTGELHERELEIRGFVNRRLGFEEMLQLEGEA